MTAHEASEIMRRAPADLPLVVYVGGVWREVEAIYPLSEVTHLPVEALVARGPVVGARGAE